MAKLKGALPLQGTVGNMTFTHTADGIIVKTKSRLNAKTIATDQQFERTRENNREFSRAAYTGRYIRHALQSATGWHTDKTTANRLTARLLKTIKADEIHERGSREIMADKLCLLQGFEFNRDSMLFQRLLQPFEIRQHSDKITAIQPPFMPDCVIDAPRGTALLQFVFCTAVFDLSSEPVLSIAASSELLRYEHPVVPGLALEINLPATTAQQLICFAGIRFFEILEGVPYPLDRGRQNCMCLCQIITKI